MSIHKSTVIILFSHLLFKWKNWLILVIICLFHLNIVAQSTNQNDRQVILEDSTATLLYKYTTVTDIRTIYEAADTVEYSAFLKDLDGSKKNQFINTGNYGSAIFPLYWDYQVNTGFNAGYNQYQRYQVKKETFRFYQQNRPVSNLYFSQSGNQDNISVGADFSRSFKNGFSVSLNYKRLSQKGFYNEQDAKSTAFGFGLGYSETSGKYTAFLLFIQNANEEKFNGGILADSLLSERFRKSIPTKLTGASGRQQEQTYSLIQYYNLHAATNTRWNLYLSNDFTYQPGYYKFWDKTLDSLAYTVYNLSADNITPGGIRRYTDIDRFSDGIFIHGYNVNGLHGKLGLVYDYWTVKDYPVSYSRSDATIVAEGKIPFLRVLEIDTRGKLGILKNIGNFDISGSIGIRVGKIGSINGGIQLFRSEPSYRETHLNLNQLIITDTSFSNPFGTRIFATLTVPLIHLTASVNQTLINNPVYWDNDGRAAQYEGLFTLSQLEINHKLNSRFFGLENNVFLQFQGNRLLPLPGIFSTHRLYYNGNWFDSAMQIRIGLEGRFIPSYNGPAFQPLTGAYHLSTTTLPLAPEINFFVHAKISNFRALLGIENFSRYWDKSYIFNVAGYPVFDPTFRLGIQWLLED